MPHLPEPLSGWYTRAVANWAFPAHERFKGHTSVALLKALELSQWWPPEQLERARVAKLRAFLTEVGERVPYYQRLFQGLGFQPQTLTSLADLQRLPLLSKALIREHQEALKSTTAGTLIRSNTGGSSGEPLIFFMGMARVSHDVAAKWRATRWWGVDIGDREIVIWGSPVELKAQDRLRALRDRVLRTELLPAFEMSAEKLDRFIATIRAMRPAMLFGYPSALGLIAQHARERGQRLDDLGVRVVFVTSERLYDHQRTMIETTFGCPAANGYGGRDAGFIAHQCPAGGMHISAEDIIVEIVAADGANLPPGQAGEIVVTHLATQDFPFIRYRTGDIGVIDEQPCRCGRGLPLLKEIQGRSTDFIIAADGTVMHGLALIYVMRELGAVEAFKIIQESRAHTRVQVVPKSAFDDATEALIRRGFQQRLGSEVRIEVERIAQIPPEQSGKFRYVVSKVPTGAAQPVSAASS